MSKEKQIIEEMAKVIKSSLDGLGSGNFHFTGDEISTMFATALYRADFRKQSEVIRCKDCEYFKEYTEEYKRDFKYKTEKADGDCHIRLINTYLGNSQYCACKYDDFCSFAKAKGGAE